MAKIQLNGMRFYAYHGCFEEEKIVGTHFEVSCTLHLNCTAAAREDDLHSTVNYQHVYNLIAQEMEQSSSILENIAYRIIKRVHELFPKVVKVIVIIHKLNPPLGGKMESVSVSLGTEDFKELKK